MSDRVFPPHVNELELPPVLAARSSVPRRDEDRTLLERCRTFATHASQLVSLLVICVGVIVWLGTLLGLHVTGTPQANAAMTQRTDSIAARVLRLEQGADTTRTQLRSLGFDVQFLSYMLCMKSKPNDPTALDECAKRIETWRARSSP